MKRQFVKYLWILLVVGIIFLTHGCGQVPLADKVIEQHADQQEQTTQTDTDSIANMKTIGEALGCVFAPQSCQK